MTRRAWDLAAIAGALALAPVVMSGWFADVLPIGDFGGYAAEVGYVRDTLLRHGRLPVWLADRFGGTTWFVGCVKELAAFPLAWAFGTVLGTKLMFVAMKIAAALAMYAIFARLLDAPAAGMLAGGAYAFSSIANHQTALGGHLDAAVSSVLLPLVLLAAVGGSTAAAVALGTLVAAQFTLPDTHAQTAVCFAIVGLVVALRPAGRGRSAVRLGGALAVFLALAAGQLAWLAADLPNHGLHAPATVEEGLEQYSELSPFMYVNRANWLGAWLDRHRPEALLFDPDEPLFGERRYLGIVPLAVCVSGWFVARRRRVLRRWYQTFALLFLLQWWLAMGPHPLVWQLGRAFGWSEQADAVLVTGLTLAAVASLVWASLLVSTPRRAGPRLELALGLALVCFAASHSLFGMLRAAVPLFRGVRSPGHFFDLAPFSFYALFGVAVVACAQAVPAGSRRRAAAVALALLLAWDFAPSRASFARGIPLDAVRRAERALAALPREDGTLRVATVPWFYLPNATLVGTEARAALGWTWLDWWAVRHWRAFMEAAMTWTVPDLDEDERTRARPVGDALARIGRLAYAIDERPPLPAFASPWQGVLRNEHFALWRRPDVGPMAAGYRAYVTVPPGDDWAHAAAVAAAYGRDALAVAATEPRPDVMAPSEAGAGPPVPVVYRRPAPERILLELDAGMQPALVFVSEAYHPWWTAAVDGRAARVVRAQMAFMAVGVGPGRHAVELRLRRPAAVAAADWLARAAWVAVALAAVWWTVARTRVALVTPRASR